MYLTLVYMLQDAERGRMEVRSLRGGRPANRRWCSRLGGKWCSPAKGDLTQVGVFRKALKSAKGCRKREPGGGHGAGLGSRAPSHSRMSSSMWLECGHTMKMV